MENRSINCSGNLQKDTEGRGKQKYPDTPFATPPLSLFAQSRSWMLWRPAAQAFHFPPSNPPRARTEGLSYQELPIFTAQITTSAQGVGWGLAAHAHPSHSAHHSLLSSRPRYASGAEVQDDHRDDGGGAVGALLLPLRWLGDQLHPEGTAIARRALWGTPAHPKNTKQAAPKLASNYHATHAQIPTSV